MNILKFFIALIICNIIWSKIGVSTNDYLFCSKNVYTQVDTTGYDHHFAGEYITNPYIIKKLEKCIKYNSRWSREMEKALYRASIWFPRLEAIFSEHGIPSDFKYIAFSESYLKNETSGCGAVGFFQLTKATAIFCGLKVNDTIDERLDPIKSAHAVCYYIKYIKKMNPSWSWTDIALAYNMGSTAFAVLKSRNRGKDMVAVHKNSETNYYMYRVLSLKEIISNPDKYGFKKNS